MTPYRYYRLSESYRDINGKTKQRMVLGLGELKDLSDQDIKTLSTLLTDMIVHNTCRLCDNPSLYEKALMFYQLYKDIKQKESVDIELKSALDLEARRLADARKREMVTLNMKSIPITYPPSFTEKQLNLLSGIGSLYLSIVAIKSSTVFDRF